ncbi:hypothetical protein EROM_040250 [Encephalitozoon romaleae SJ-2008]|uniref:Uncharacterized protein n=1 Tax=Encephalitozoon romaleae (strain SJ-2008) TaxID=1178016 RepID=I7AM79_ENCRO|nr:hypothetical protein EROM_040250 [Encephalitozoon romaleae SJ-2008]AFN82794.1 hypothetical protein EROM_040250 [Encephalitozoon romaleae SJ-2008]
MSSLFMSMHERKFETNEYSMLIYTTGRGSILSCDSCVELITPVHINFPKEFILKENRIFCKIRIEGCYRRLKIVKIERMSGSCNAYTVLKRLIPSVFDVKFIRKANLQSYLHSNRDLIMRSSLRILGRETVDQINLWDRIKWQYGQDSEAPLDETKDVSSDILISDYW